MSRLNIYSKEQIDANVGSSEDTASASGTLWARLKNAVARIVGLESADAQNVKLTGAQTIAGQKTMNDSPIVPTTPTTATGAVNSVYVNDATDGVNNIVHKSGNETKAGRLTLQLTSGDVIYLKQTTSEYSTSPSSTIYSAGISFRDKNGNEFGTLLFNNTSNGVTNLIVRLRKSDGSIQTKNIISGDVVQ